MFSDLKTIFSLCLLVLLAFTGMPHVESQTPGGKGQKGQKGKNLIINMHIQIYILLITAIFVIFYNSYSHDEQF